MAVTKLNSAIESDRDARMALACISEPADLELVRLVAAEGAMTVWQSLTRTRSGSRWAKRLGSLRMRETRIRMEQRQLRFVVPGDEEWPDAFGDLERADPMGASGGAPLGVWVVGPGNLAEWTQRAVSIVGSRASTSYGETVASELAADLAADGITVISGGAYGIDTFAHRGAVAVQGRSIALLAGGLDDPYPRGNSRLFDTFRKEQLIVSELPPGAHPTRLRFLGRNRLIAALGQATVVVEAALRSGARNTASWAGLCHRHVLAVPGPVHSAMSATPHQLVRDGEATLVTSAAQVREVIAPMGQDMLPLERGRTRVVDRLNEIQRLVFEVVPGRGGLGAGELAVRCGLDLLSTLSALSELEEHGLIEQGTNGGWKLVPGSVG